MIQTALNQCHYNQVTWSFMTQNFLIILVTTGVFFLKFLFFIFILTDAYIADQGGRHSRVREKWVCKSSISSSSIWRAGR